MKNSINTKLVLVLGTITSIVFGTLTAAFTNSNQTNQSDSAIVESSDVSILYRKMNNKSFGEGEVLNFRVHYGFINAANIKMEVKSSNESFNRPEELKGRKAYHIVIEGKTLKAFDWAFKVRDRFDSWVDMESMAPLKYSKSVIENNYTDQDLVYFRHISKKLTGKKGDLEMPSYTQDIVSALYYARNIDFKNATVGDTFPINVYLDNVIYNLNFKYAGTETIKTDIGKVKCYKLIPRLVVDRVFKGEEDMTVWISADDNKIPIRVKSEIQVGSLKVDITGYSGLKNAFDAKVK